MKPTRNALLTGCGWTQGQLPPTPHRRWAAQEIGPGKPTTIRALARAFMKFRAARRAEDPSVDSYFSRGESAVRFAYLED